MADASVDAGPADPTRSTIVVDKTTAIAGEQVTVTVTARDSLDAPLVGASVQLVATGTMNVIATAPPTDATGTTTAAWISALAGSHGIDAIINGVTVNGPVVYFSPGPAERLGFVQQPGDVIAGAPFVPAVTVEAQDANGNRVDTTTGYVALSLQANPGMTSLRGTANAALQNGVATFSAAHVDVAGMGYSLRAQSPGLTAATSAFFDVAWGAPSETYSKVTVAPASLEANAIDTTRVTFRVANEYAVAIQGHAASLGVSGTNNTLVPSTGTTNNQGELVATLSSSTAEIKTVTGTAGMITATATVHFYRASCMPMLPGGVMTPVEDFSSALHVIDVDGDNVRDAIVAISNELDVFLGNGDGTFAAAIRLPISGNVNDIDSGDFNADGHRDLVLSMTGTSALTVWLGNGAGQFPTTKTTVLPSDPGTLGVADLDGNGKLDVIVSVPGSSKVLAKLGVGTGTFTGGGAITGVFTRLAIIDANGDSKLDVLLADNDSTSLARGVGNGTFQALTAAAPTGGLLLTADFNNDVKVDVATASSDGVLTPYLGNGNGTFTASNSVVYRGASQPLNASGGGGIDLDADGKLDIVVGAGRTTTILKGSGTGTFTLNRTYSAATEAVADMTGDNRVDLIGRYSFGIGVVAGTASIAFVGPVELFQNLAFNAWLYDTAADFDGNGRVDYVRWRSGSTDAMSVLLTQLNGSIVEAPTSAATPDPYDAVAADFSGDGKADVAIVDGAFSGVTLGLALGNGTGSLAAFTSQNVAFPYSTRLDAGDFNQDGKQDLVLFYPGHDGVSIAPSTGTGFGTLQTYASPVVDSVVVRDVSGDAVPDLIVAGGTGFAAEIRVYVATGTGTLMPSVSYGTGGFTGVVGVGDLTSDGVVDLVFLQGDFLTSPRAVVVYPGLGTGSFGSPIVTPNVRIPKYLDYETLHVADVTNDGDADLVVHASHGTTVIASYGDGYVRQTPLHYPFGHQGGTQTDTVVMSDHDANGRPDFVYWDAGLVLATNAGCTP